LKQLGVIAEDETPTADMYTTSIFQLNAIVTAAQAIGLHVWTEEEGILFLQGGANGAAGQVRYEIGGPGVSANTADANQWVQLTLTATLPAGVTALTVASIAGVNANDNIGVVLDTGVTFWTTVNGAPTGSTVNLAAVLPSSVSSGNYAMTYTTAISRPLKIPNARLLYLNGLTETSMTVLSRQEYMDLPNKTSGGSPTQWFYTPQVDRGILYVWPAPSTTKWAMRFTWYRPLQDFFSPGDTMDFPQEWVSPLMWNLAHDLMGVFDTPLERQGYIEKQMVKYGDLAISYDRESEPIQFGIDT
jgi:hypothetical protein